MNLNQILQIIAHKMPVYLNTRIEQISEDDLVKVFGLFCEAYNLEFSDLQRDAHVRFLRRYGIENLRGQNGLEFIPHPHSDVRFFGHRKGNLTKFLCVRHN